MDNFTPLRNGLVDHIQQGKLCPFDLGIYTVLHLRADWATGIYQGCALSIAYLFGDPGIKEHIQKSLRSLRRHQYINYRKGDGTRGGYPILINKYQPRVGTLSGTRLNAWKHGELALPEYEPWNGDGTVETLSWHGGDTAVAPIQEVKKLQEVRETPSCPPSADATKGKASEVIEIWNRTAKGTNLPSARLTEKRRKVIHARLKEQGWFDDFTVACAYVRCSDFHRGQNDRNWVANLDYVLQAGKATELAEKAKAISTGKPNGKPAGTSSALDYQAELLRQANSGVQQ